MLYAFIALELLALIVSAVRFFAGASLLSDFEAGARTVADLDAFDATAIPLLVVMLIAIGGTFIAMLAWLSRSVDNTPHLLGGTPKQSPRWSIGWWFIPFANLVMPYRAMVDVDRRNAQGVAAPIRGLILTWWLVGIVAATIDNVVSRIPTETIEALRSWFVFAGVTEIPTIAALVLQVIVVRRIQRNADERARHISEAAPALGHDPPSDPPLTA